MSYTITATYKTFTAFDITPDMKLLPAKENTEEAFFKRTPGAWYIIWDTLHYIDQNGDDQKLAGCTGEASKHPDDIYEE